MDNINNENKIISHENIESDECFAKGICSLNPNVSSVNEIILLYLKELSFYILKLKDFGITNEKLKETVIYAVFNLITNVEYNQEQFHVLISNLYEYISQSKMLYEKTCLEKNIDIEVLKTYFKYTKNFTLTDAKRKGEKYFLKRSSTFNQTQKDFYEIFLFFGKSIGIKIIEMERLGEFNDEAYYGLLSLLNINIPKDISQETLQKDLEKIIEIYYDLVKKIFELKTKLYGKSAPKKVSLSTKAGKAILVSGTDFKKLELVLKATEGTDISVYTHGLEMLMAHSYPKLASHPNLQGHFGSGLESSLIDFAAFPGPILMTKASLQKVEYLYRGRLFTLDPIAPLGVVILKDFNFDHLIKSALEAKGFINATLKEPLEVGFDEKEIENKVDSLLEKMANNEIKHLYIIGLLNAPNLAYKNYFETFLKILPKDCFVLSLCCPINTANVFHLESFYDYSLLYNILNRIQLKSSIKDLKLSIFLTRCDKHTISNLLYLKHIGINSLYMCKCPSSLINPSIIKTLQETFGIKEITDPHHDMNETLQE